MPWPKRGDSLLSDHVGAERYVFPYDKWIPDKLERLGLFSLLYRDRARDLVRLWLYSRDKPENFVYPVGYLYRHAIELDLKATIARSQSFRMKAPEEQREVLLVHSLHKLWCKVKPLIQDFVDDADTQAFERQLLELHHLDEGSDEFRYPFHFVDRDGGRRSVLEGLHFKSFDNFVWILEGLTGWVRSLEDQEERHREYRAEVERDAGW